MVLLWTRIRFQFVEDCSSRSSIVVCACVSLCAQAHSLHIFVWYYLPLSYLSCNNKYQNNSQMYKIFEWTSLYSFSVAVFRLVPIRIYRKSVIAFQKHKFFKAFYEYADGVLVVGFLLGKRQRTNKIFFKLI